MACYATVSAGRTTFHLTKCINTGILILIALWIMINRLLRKAQILRCASALVCSHTLKYAPLLDPRDALSLSFFKRPAKQGFFNTPLKIESSCWKKKNPVDHSGAA
jgi:hypothetical protein